MAAHSCPHCQTILTCSEARSGRCPLCAQSFDIVSNHDLTDVNHHLLTAGHSPSGLSAGWSALVVGLTAALLISFLLPIGAAQSLLLSWRKGGSICAEGSCTRQATEAAEYSKGHKIRYCRQHIGSAPRTVQKKSFGMPFFYTIFFIWYVGCYVGAVKDVFANPVDEKKRGYFLKMWVGGFVGANAVLWIACRWLLVGS